MDFSCAIILTNRNFRIRSWNRAAERIYGWLSDEIAGKNLNELLNTSFIGSSLEEAVSGLLTAERIKLDVKHTARDGSMLMMRGTAYLSRNGEGEITGIVHVLRDVTVHEDAPQDIEKPVLQMPEKSVEFVELLEGLAEDLWVYDIPSNTEWHSSQWAKKKKVCPADAAQEEDGEGTVHPDDWERVDSILKQAVAEKKERFSLQYRTCLKDGAYAWSLNQGRIEYDGSGKAVRMYGTTTDISEMKALELQLRGQVSGLEHAVQELESKNKLMTDFFTNISHEFKTPLSIILVDLQLMEYRLKEASGPIKDKLSKTVSIMRQNALRLLRLVGNLLDVTKIEAGFMKARLINGDIVALTAGLTESVRNYAVNAGIALSFECDRGSRLIPVDNEKLERIMLNLLSNAIKHTRPGGHIVVRLTNEPNLITISVKDDGEGIAEDKKDFIFDRFRQVNTSLTRLSEGCGIGLALTQALVALLRGRIWFESKAGAGSEFFVELPVLQADWQAMPPEIDGMSREKKVEMEFSDINKIER